MNSPLWKAKQISTPFSRNSSVTGHGIFQALPFRLAHASRIQRFPINTWCTNKDSIFYFISLFKRNETWFIYKTHYIDLSKPSESNKAIKYLPLIQPAGSTELVRMCRGSVEPIVQAWRLSVLLASVAGRTPQFPRLWCPPGRPHSTPSRTAVLLSVMIYERYYW